jgi:aspartyl-tRNA(Asn)/glutamyl-tRNA(Gln) amidotransferase subunit A
VAREHFGEGLDKEVEAAVRDALKVYQKLGATIKDVSLPNSPHAVATYYLVATAEASSNLARYDGTHYGHRAEKFDNLIDMMGRSRDEGFGAEVKRRIMLGTFVLSSGYIEAYYVKALRLRRLIRDDFDRAFRECDVIIGPTSPTPAFRLGEKSTDPLAMYLSDIYTIGANLAGITGVSVPCGFTKAGLPIGMQILAGPFEEEKLLRVARMYERETDWVSRRPSI